MESGVTGRKPGCRDLGRSSGVDHCEKLDTEKTEGGRELSQGATFHSDGEFGESLKDSDVAECSRQGGVVEGRARF